MNIDKEFVWMEHEAQGIKEDVWMLQRDPQGKNGINLASVILRIKELEATARNLQAMVHAQI